MATANFNDLINSDSPVLVDFFADWCGPCKTQAPILENVKTALGDSVTIVKIDVDKNQRVAARYSVRSIPTLILFKSGEIVWQKTGVATEQELKQILAQHV